MATSTFQDVRAALVTLISPITDCEITAYPPYGDSWTIEDRVWLAEIRVDQEKLAFGGPRSEELEIDLVIYAPRFGSDMEDWAAAEQRAEAILAAIEADVRGDDSIGGTVMNADIATFRSRIDMSHEHGPVGMIELTITAEANL